MLGKYRVDATINSQNQITRIKTTVSEPALGDFNIEHESTEPDDVRQREVADRVALASRVGRQLAVLPPEHRTQRLRRQVPERAAERLRRSRAGAAVRGAGERSTTAVTVDEDGRRRVPAGRRAGQQLHGGVQRLRGRVRGAGERRAQPRGHRGDREAGARASRFAGSISSHPHFDHIGGLRTYLHIGATDRRAHEEHRVPE